MCCVFNGAGCEPLVGVCQVSVSVPNRSAHWQHILVLTSLYNFNWITNTSAANVNCQMRQKLAECFIPSTLHTIHSSSYVHSINRAQWTLLSTAICPIHLPLLVSSPPLLPNRLPVSIRTSLTFCALATVKSRLSGNSFGSRSAGEPLPIQTQHLKGMGLPLKLRSPKRYQACW